MRPLGLELLDDGEQVADRAGEAIEADHDQGLAGADVAQQAGQHRAGAIGAGGVLLEDGGAAGGAEFVALRIGALFLRGDPGVADQAAWGRRHPGFQLRHVGVMFRIVPE
jgi:hypothetical protein